MNTVGHDQEKEIERQARRAGIASFVGTTIEWYDFYIYGLSASLVFGEVFFSGDLDRNVATLLSFATLWVGFLARPVGGILFGHLGDRLGRKTTLVITLMMMGVATTCIGLLPTYAQIGAAAPVLLVFLRILQGIAVGGEWGGAVLIASENAPKGKGILYSAFAQQGAPTGNLLAIGMFFALTTLPKPEFLLHGGWRIPFLLSSVLIVIGMVIRLRIHDAKNVQKLIAENKSKQLPLTEVVRNHPRLLLYAIGSLPVIYITYFKTNFAVAWATGTVGYDKSTFLGLIAVCVIVQCLTQPFGAVLAHKINMRKAVLLMTVPEFFLMPFMFYAIGTQNYWLAMFAMCLATIPHGMFYGAIGGILARAFPAHVRYTGLSLSNQMSAVIFGGAAPSIAQFILYKTGSIVGVALVSGGYALISLVCVLALLKMTGASAKDLSHAEREDERQLQKMAISSPEPDGPANPQKEDPYQPQGSVI